jgi:hypothetical protein
MATASNNASSDGVTRAAHPTGDASNRIDHAESAALLPAISAPRRASGNGCSSAALS